MFSRADNAFTVEKFSDLALQIHGRSIASVVIAQSLS
jgi:hypothetical protein